MGKTSHAYEDFAFADTIVVNDLEEPPPPSGIVLHDTDAVPHVMAPPPAASHRRPRQTFQQQQPPPQQQQQPFWDELKQMWVATASLEEVHDGRGQIVRDEDPFVRAATVGRRVRTLFSFFEWDRADVLRATWIGLAVFLFVATIGAIVLRIGS